ncbi:MAG: aminotransferase class III-fold pyridoxal phosphate-dependent enzyme [Candidatus Acidoferrum typicum]|nr:aminotransferase class III-fold pyridoxal phosphate-dependent enzyme [Candidatus Acidoferrum typicum]
MLLEERVARATTEAEAVELARGLYGLAVAAKALPGEYDDNFHLRSVRELVGAQPDTAVVRSNSIDTKDDTGAGFVLKVMHPARERSFIDMQCRGLQHLAERAPQLSLPRVRLNLKGESFAAVTAADGTQRLVWLLSYVPGTLRVKARPHSPELLQSVGQFLGEMDAALADFAHPAVRRELKWDLTRAGWIRAHLHHLRDASQRALVETFLALYEGEVVPALPALRRSVVYGDANDYNVLVGEPLPLPRKIASVIDFGDMHESVTISEVAIAAAYAILGKETPLRAAAEVVAGYHRAFPLMDEELRVLYALIGARLAVSVVNSAQRASVKPDDAYVTVSEAPAWEALGRLANIHPRFAHFTFREACGRDAVPQSESVRKWLIGNGHTAASVLDLDLRTAPSLVFDFSVGSTLLGADPSIADPAVATERIFAEMKRACAEVGVGRYDEARAIYTAAQFGGGSAVDERRTIHLGIDLHVQAGAAVRAPFDAVVHSFANNTAALDYGPVVILRHSFLDLSGETQEFFTLYGHLSVKTLAGLRVGQKIARRERFGEVGETTENGGWVPHLHFQIISDLLNLGTDFPGVARASERRVWTSLSPDPNLLLGIPADRFPAQESKVTETLAARKSLLGKNLSISYRRPLKIVRGWMQYLYDDTGRAYLDVYNNVPLVGHSHPRVVRAAQDQLALLNTNTRYLHDNVLRYAERLTELLPQPLRVCYFVNSGSEANELALRLARAYTGRKDVIVLEHAYHGHTNTLIDISPYKFNGPGGRGRKPWVHVAPIADDYRGPYRRGDAEAGAKYAAHVSQILEQVRSEGRGVAAYLAETLPSVAGQVVFPPNYLAEVYRQVRAAGAVCIADEVQVGFGRLGSHFWGFETQGVVPDIAVFGKPIGNAFPLAAVVTTQEIAASFANGMEFFSTFGGNPVACAAGLAVLDVVRDEGLQDRALRVGKYWMTELKKLQECHRLIGDVRGSGLFLGIDLVRDRETREPATEQADYAVNRLRECGILAGTDGPHHNVIKLRPPLIFAEDDVDLFVSVFEAILQEDGALPA